MKLFRRISVIALFISIGFSREFLFVNLNYQINHIYYKNYDYQLPELLSFFSRFDYSTLYYLKYPFTALFIFIYFLLTRWAVLEFSQEKKYLRWVLLSYIIVIFTAGFALMGIVLINNFSEAYLTARKIIELAESPLMIMILLPVIYLHQNNNYAKG